MSRLDHTVPWQCPITRASRWPYPLDLVCHLQFVMLPTIAYCSHPSKCGVGKKAWGKAWKQRLPWHVWVCGAVCVCVCVCSPSQERKIRQKWLKVLFRAQWGSLVGAWKFNKGWTVNDSPEELWSWGYGIFKVELGKRDYPGEKQVARWVGRTG